MRTFRVAGLLVVVAAIAASVGFPLLSSASSPAPSLRPEGASRSVPSSLGSSSTAPAASTNETLRAGHGAALGEADGILPDRVTASDEQYAGILNLDPDLRGALLRATTAAARDRVELDVASGWRSRNYQAQLFREAVSKYGSAAIAARWVAVPGTSTHESGDAVDIGPSAATAWLSANGSRYGLCQIYRNETWHFELRPEAIDRGCPRMYADPTNDPRMKP